MCTSCNDKLVQAANRHEVAQVKSRSAAEGKLVLTADVQAAGGAKTAAAPDLG